MRRIKNISDEPLSVPLLGITVQPGDVANVGEEFDYVDFSSNYWEVDGDEPNRDVVEIYADDHASGNESEGN